MSRFCFTRGFLVLCLLVGVPVLALIAPLNSRRWVQKNRQGASFSSSPATRQPICSSTMLQMAQVSEQEAKAGIDKVVNAIRRDRSASSELGNLVKVNNILGYGSPSPGILAVRFNASFKKGGMGRSALPMPFGLGQTNESEGRGTMVGQVKASLNTETGKLLSCSVFRDLGYGRSFEMKV